MVTDLSAHVPRPCRRGSKCSTSGSPASAATPAWSGCSARSLDRGPGVLPGRAATWCSATSPTTGCCAGTRPPAPSACSASRPGYANGHTVDRAGPAGSAASTGNRRVDPHRARRQRSPCSPTATTAGGSTAPTTSSSGPTARSGSPIPSYGIDSDYEGHRGASEIGGCHVYRIDPSTGDVQHRRRRLRAAQRPGLQRRRAASSTSPTPARAHPPLRRRRRRHAVRRRGLRRLRRRHRSTGCGSTTRAGCGPPRTTGCTASTPTARCSASCCVPEVVANLTFGGPQRNHLFITATTSVYTLRVNFSGATYPTG